MKSNGDSNPLRDELLDLLAKSSTSSDEDLSALLQCADQIRNRRIVERTAKECGLRLDRFLSDEILELYYDLKRGRHDVGYISKGWKDPGFRIGDVVEMSKTSIQSFKEHVFPLLKFCAVRGVGITFEEKEDVVEIQMDSVIYPDGFNKKVFEQVLHYLNDCVERVNGLIRQTGSK
jgi:hypothetical protein